MDIALGRPDITDVERELVLDVLDSGDVKGGGEYDRRCADLIESSFGVDAALMTTSCTHALEMAAMLLDVGAGDEVVVPSYTFPSTATAFERHGADIVFCDVKPETLNIDPDDLAEKVGPKTAAVVPVHYAGVGCEMERITAIARRHDAAVVEDAAQGVNATYRGEALGTIGDIGCYSFHGTKNYVAGEGGALLLNDERFVERAEFIKHKGTNYRKFQRGEVDAYTWVHRGSSYVPSELQMALAYGQLQRREEIQTARRENYEYYNDHLETVASGRELRLPTVPSDRSSNCHIFYLLAADPAEREALGDHLVASGVGAAPHYQPLHTSKMGERFGYGEGDCPVTEQVTRTLLRLPVHPGVGPEERRAVVDSVRSFYEL